MTIDLLLCLLLVFQQIYWAGVTHKLLDKLMSRNYHEYKQAESYKVVDRPKPSEGPFEDLRALNDFNPL